MSTSETEPDGPSRSPEALVARPQRMWLWVAGAATGAAAIAAVVATFLASPAAPAPAAASPQIDLAVEAGLADRQVCSDLNARGGLFHHTYVVKVMGSGPSGMKSISVDSTLIAQAIDSLEGAEASIDPSGAPLRSRASAAIASEAQDLTTAAKAFRGSIRSL